jgi:hypothetical protein
MLIVFQNVCAAMVQNRVATAVATVEAVALLEGGPLKNLEPDIDLPLGGTVTGLGIL